MKGLPIGSVYGVFTGEYTSPMDPIGYMNDENKTWLKAVPKPSNRNISE